MLRLLSPWLLVSVASAQISFGPSQEVSDFINQPRATRAVDMDGDGDLDVLAAEGTTVRVLWWENMNHDGVFSNRREWLGDAGGTVLSLADHNGDGRADIWYVKGTPGPLYLNELWIVPGLPGGTFGTPVLKHSNELEGGEAEALADVDRDGRLDILMGEGVCYGQADGSFGPLAADTNDLVFPLYALIDGPGYWALGNFTGDAAVEFASFDSVEAAETVSLVSLPTGGPPAAGVAVYTFPEGEQTRWLTVLPPRPGEPHERLLVETASVTEAGEPLHQLRLLEFPEGGPATLTATITLSPLGSYGDVQAAQWDEEGQRLLIAWDSAVDRPNSRVGFINANDPAPVLTPLFEFTGIAAELILADLNDNATGDLLMPLSVEYGYSTISFDQITWHQASGGGIFEETPRFVSQASISSNLAYAGDVDGDGDGDIITHGASPTGPMASYFSNQIILWRNLGGSFTRQVVAEGYDWVWPIAVRDLNGDSRSDLLVQAYERDAEYEEFPEIDFGIQRILRGTQQADGSFVFEEILQEELFTRDNFIGEVDWDGDGILDLLLQAIDAPGGLSSLAWMRGTASGDYEEVEYLMGPLWVVSIPDIIDMDRDGDPDLVDYGFLFNGRPYWLENDGSGEIATIRKLPHDIYPAGDFDGDGFRDFEGLGGYYASRPGVSFELLGAGPPEAGAPLGSVAYLDLDGDGDSDRVDGSAAFGHLGLIGLGWLENRDGVFEASYVRPEGDPYDQQDRPIDDPRLVDRRQAAMCDMDGDGIRDLVVVSLVGRIEWFKITRATTPAAFAAWMGQQGLSGNAAGPLSDWDLDGISNWNEFAFGSNPAVFDPAHPGLPRVTLGEESVFSFRRRTDAAALGLAYPVQRSTDMVAWDDLLEVPAVSEPADGYETFTLPLDLSTLQQFFRVLVSDPE